MSLVELLKERDDRAFCFLYEKYKKLLYTVANSILNNHEQSIDVVYEVFNRIYVHPERLKEDKNIKYYLTTMARNLALDAKKKQLRYEPLVEENLKEEEHDKFKLMELDKILNELGKIVTKQELDILVMHLIDDLGYSEISKILGLNYNQVAGLAHRAISKIKKIRNLDSFYE